MATGGDISTDASLDHTDENISSSQVPRTPAALVRDQKGAAHARTLGAGAQVISPKGVSVCGKNSSLNSMRPVQTAKPIEPSEDSFLQYLQFFPDHLREDNFDILIINATKDTHAAMGFKEHLEKDIIVYVNQKPLRPRVKLLEEFTFSSKPYDLDFAFEKTLYVFLYVTKDFCECTWTLLKGQACLTEAIRDPHKQWCVIPVHTKSRKNQNYKLPMMLGSLRPINYWVDNVDQFYSESVRRLIESKLSLLVQRDITLKDNRIKYFNDHKEELVKYYNAFHNQISASVEVICPFVVQESVHDSGFVESVPELESESTQLQNLTINSQNLPHKRDLEADKIEALKQSESFHVDNFSEAKEGLAAVLSDIKNTCFTSTETCAPTFDQNSESVGSESATSSSSGYLSNNISFDGPPNSSGSKNLSPQSSNEVTNQPKPLQSQQLESATSSSSGYLSSNISIDGPSNSFGSLNLSRQSSNEVTNQPKSLQSQQLFSNYPSLTLNLSNQNCIVGPNGVTYALTAYGYVPVWPGNQHVNLNVSQSDRPHTSIPYGPSSDSTQSSLNVSMEPNLSGQHTVHQIPSLPSQFSGPHIVPLSYPFSGYYMPPFPTAYPVPVSLPSYSHESLLSSYPPLLSSQPPISSSQPPASSFLPPALSYQPSGSLSQPPESWGQLNQSNPDEKKPFQDSSDLKAPLDSPKTGQVDDAGDAKNLSDSSSGTVQHIHHHYHHKKEIRIEKATNVVIGDKSQLNTHFGSPDFPNSDATTGSRSVGQEELIIGNDTIQSTLSESTSRSVPSADCHHESSQNQPPKESMGFPECSDPSSIRQPVENSDTEIHSNNFYSNEITYKKII